MQKLIALNENGRRIGLSYAEVALKFDVSKSCVAHIANGRRRGQATERTVRVSVNR